MKTLEELMVMPVDELEDHADTEIGEMTIKLSASQLAAVCTALFGSIAEMKEADDPRHVGLRQKMTEALTSIYGQAMPTTMAASDLVEMLNAMEN